MNNAAGDAFARLVDLMAILRSPEGCPWDREQTHQSLKRNLLEETYEVLEAIDGDTAHLLTEELGDVLLQIMFHSQIASESRTFDIVDVIEAIRSKLVRRHPHVFGETKMTDTKEVEDNWEKLKRQERANSQELTSLLGNLPLQMPALAYSQLMQDRASRSGFDWDTVEGVLDKVVEELEEIDQAATQEEKSAEFGDLLFTIVNAGRWLGVQTEDALRLSNARFYRRFMAMERIASEQGTAFETLSLEKKDRLWGKVKAIERASDK
ncbi:MAG: nucleoside triphosphate pyrophosphohydrolase [Chloroflexota bacterium]|nr:nucleoside triphosphate pyrophosphohydrolase [Chloroflexota bacterium]